MIKGNAIAVIVLSSLILVMNAIGLNAEACAYATALIIFASVTLKRRDNASIGTLLLGSAAIGFVFADGFLMKVFALTTGLLSIGILIGQHKEKKEKYPFLSMSEEEIQEEKKLRKLALEKEMEEEKKITEEIEAKEELREECVQDDMPAEEVPAEATTAEEAPAEEAPAEEAPAEEAPAEEAPAEEAPEEGTLEATVDAPDECTCEPEETADECTCEECSEEEEEVPGLTEMITDEEPEEEEFYTDEEWKEQRYLDEAADLEDPERPLVADEVLTLLNTADEGYTAPDRHTPENTAPEVIVLVPGENGEKTPERKTLESIFRRDENTFVEDEPFTVMSEEGFGLDGNVKLIRWTLRNRTGKEWKYASFSVSLTDLLGNPIEAEDTDIVVDRKILPGEIFRKDIPYRGEGAVRGAEAHLRVAVDIRGDVSHYENRTAEERIMLRVPPKIRLADKLGEHADEFLKDYAEEYGLSFTPEWAYTLNEKGSACTCPCCGEDVKYEEKECPCCGAPRDRFVFATPDFMKRSFGRWSEIREAGVKKEAEIKARKEQLEKLREEQQKEAEKRENNRKSNIKMWSVTFTVVVFVFLGWLYYHI